MGARRSLDNIENMRVLITGGFGFIGGRVAQYLQREGYQVVLGSRTEQISPDWLPQAKVVKTNWYDDISLEKICNKIDVVIHAAGMNAQDCTANPVAALEFNGLSTTRFVGAAYRVGVKRFIYLSTAHVYASPLVGCFTEDTCPRNLHPYATSHIAGENSVLGANHRGEIEGIVLRLSNAFGAPVHNNVNCWMLLVNDLCKQAVQTGTMSLRSSGQQQRNFITMEDTTHGLRCLLELTKEQYADGLFNLGGITLSVWEMVQLIAYRCQRLLGFLPNIKRLELNNYEQDGLLQYSCDKLSSVGCKLRGNIENEIDMTLLFCANTWGNRCV